MHINGDKLARTSYQAIALLSKPGKIFLRSLRNKNDKKKMIKSMLNVRKTYGFCPGFPILNRIFYVRVTIEKSRNSISL